MTDFLPVLLIHAWFWLVAALSIAFQRWPMLVALFIATTVAMFACGYLTGWANCETSKLHEDKPA